MKRYRSINWAVADQAMISGVNFLTGILLARFLGVTEFGIFTLAWLVVEFIQGLQYSLIIMPMLSIGPKQPEHERRDYYGSVIAQQAGFGILSAVFFLIGILAFNKFFAEWNLDQLTWSLTVAVLVTQFQNFVRRFFFAFGRIVLAFFVDFVRYAAQLGILFWLLLTVDMDPSGTLWVISGTSLVSIVLGACFFEKVTWNSNNFRLTFFRHWTFSKWLLLSELVRWTTGNFYMFVAGGMLGAAAVGVIRAAQNLVGLSHIMMLGLENVVPASAARRLHQGGKAALLRYLKRVTVFGGCSVGAIIVVASAAPEFWLELIYGKEYVGNGHLVLWWSANYLLSFLALVLSFGLRTIEQTKPMFWAHLAAAIFSVVSVYPLIAYFDAIGVMIGLVVIVLVRMALLAYSFFNQIRKVED